MVEIYVVFILALTVEKDKISNQAFHAAQTAVVCH